LSLHEKHVTLLPKSEDWLHLGIKASFSALGLHNLCKRNVKNAPIM